MLSPYEEFANEPLQFPIGGKVYTLPPVSIETGLYLATVIAGKSPDSETLGGEDLWKILLGPLWDEMAADGVPIQAAIRAGLTALADFQYGRDIAEATWITGGDPKAIQKYVDLTNTPPSTSTAVATTTRRPASTSGTKTSPPKSRAVRKSPGAK